MKKLQGDCHYLWDTLIRGQIGQSCLTQLLQHFDDILENFLDGNDTRIASIWTTPRNSTQLIIRPSSSRNCPGMESIRR